MKAVAVIVGLVLCSSASFASDHPKYTVAQIKLMLSKDARDAHAQGCRQGQVWCCKKTFSGATSCECTGFCN